MNFLNVRVISPSGELQNFKARSVSSNNSSGRFDILPGHANFVTYISDKTIDVISEDKEKIALNYPVAIIQVIKDQVSIFIDVETFKAI